ncbi:hypothetical protein GUITHDRAFT_136855 [Guillardia theta CCMP2712]|uniref:Uncharacterized protein n=1 Tax=Guillardia theta (strain CCMP2712) TaxID=905079 RepID=L1JIP0_GUITC|nr:hypothetical protein GUITHDRAFT_136855 [Guillardia theta CCMP2712]EKX48346.1 hypothetical protein GUITHDRAFT_136855 [Guillardia theta CCMP2712]|eukprot:XP_005835326.1 hypothetical protein GUITHDRAFT_136855 [Guillardia theta CCMP2712]
MAAVPSQDATSSLYSLLLLPSSPPLPPPSFSLLDRGEEAVEETAGEIWKEFAGETVCEKGERQPEPAGKKKKRRNRKKNRKVEIELSGPALENLQYQASRANCFYPKGSEWEGEPDVERFLNEVAQGLHQLDPVPKPSRNFEDLWKEVKAELQLPSDCNPTNIEEIEDERAMLLHIKKAQQEFMPYLDMFIQSTASFCGEGNTPEEYLEFFDELFRPQSIGYLNHNGGASDEVDEEAHSQMAMYYVIRSSGFRKRVREMCLAGLI